MELQFLREREPLSILNSLKSLFLFKISILTSRLFVEQSPDISSRHVSFSGYSTDRERQCDVKAVAPSRYPSRSRGPRDSLGPASPHRLVTFRRVRRQGGGETLFLSGGWGGGECRPVVIAVEMIRRPNHRAG